jgi:hypothetical protein
MPMPPKFREEFAATAGDASKSIISKLEIIFVLPAGNNLLTHLSCLSGQDDNQFHTANINQRSARSTVRAYAAFIYACKKAVGRYPLWSAFRGC